MTEMVTVYVMGKEYKVPKGLTIMRAMEYIGYKFIRGAGCRAGFCGACATVYRLKGDYRIRNALACQQIVEDGMYLAQIPFYPPKKATYDIKKIKPDVNTILTHYPEVARCVSCNSCTKICPQELDVMDYVQAAIRGDIERVADLSFDCIMCGLCTSRCPAEITQYYVAILCRRLYGRYLAPRAKHVQKRIREIQSGKFDKEMKKIMKMSKEQLKKLYAEREIEK